VVYYSLSLFQICFIRVFAANLSSNWTFVRHPNHNLPSNNHLSFADSGAIPSALFRKQRSTSLAKKVIGIGIIGAGFARTTQIPAFKDCIGAKVVSIASAHRENAERVAEEFKIRHVGNDWRDVVSSPDVDLVTVVTPPATHKEITLAALEHGKHVLCEKPMALNAAEAREMTERAAAAGVLALIDHELRFLNSRRMMRAMLHGGAIGKVRHCNYVFRSDYRGVLDRPWDWWADEKMGGGTLGAIGSHAIDSFRYMLEVEIAEVFCMLSSHIAERPDKNTGEMRPVTSDDEAKLMFRLADSELTHKTTGAAALSVVESGGYENRLEIYGTTGALMVEETGELWHSPAGSGSWRPVPVDQDSMAAGMRPGSWSRGFTAFSGAIIDALHEGNTTVENAATFADGYRIQLVLDAARDSHQRGCWVKVE